VGVHVADGSTNNDGEWMAVLRAAQCIDENGLTGVEIITDSQVVTNQLNNNVGVNEPSHAAVYDMAAALLANCPNWRIRHVHSECNYGAGAMRVHHMEVAVMPWAVEASTRARATEHLGASLVVRVNSH
jgi:hypothetical protein